MSLFSAYLVRELCGKSMTHIAEPFSLGSYGGVGAARSVIERQGKKEKGLPRKIKYIRKMARQICI
jgi:hypothetical protein